MAKRKLSKAEDDFINYLQISKSKNPKESGEFIVKQNFTIDSIDIPRTTKEVGLVKITKPGHK